MSWERGPMSDENKQAISQGWARRKAGAPTKKERRAIARKQPTLTQLGHIRKPHPIHRYAGDDSGFLTFQQIGDACGVSKNACNVIYNRGLRKIAEEVMMLQTPPGVSPTRMTVEQLMAMPEFEELIIEALQSSVVQ